MALPFTVIDRQTLQDGFGNGSNNGAALDNQFIENGERYAQVYRDRSGALIIGSDDAQPRIPLDRPIIDRSTTALTIRGPVNRQMSHDDIWQVAPSDSVHYVDEEPEISFARS